MPDTPTQGLLTPQGLSTPQYSDKEEAKEADKFSFTDEELKEEHIKLRKKISVQKRRETRIQNTLERNIEQVAERGILNLRASDCQLMGAQVEVSIEDMRKAKDAKI